MDEFFVNSAADSIIRTCILNLQQKEYDILDEAWTGPRNSDLNQFAGLSHAILYIADAEWHDNQGYKEAPVHRVKRNYIHYFKRWEAWILKVGDGVPDRVIRGLHKRAHTHRILIYWQNRIHIWRDHAENANQKEPQHNHAR
jgi:hypothetical protein